MIPTTEADRKYAQYFDTVLRQLAATVRDTAPDPRRVDRGLLLALNRYVTLGLAEAFVRSDHDPEVQYRVRAGICDCPDWSNAPEHACKHVWAVTFARQAQRALAAAIRADATPHL